MKHCCWCPHLHAGSLIVCMTVTLGSRLGRHNQARFCPWHQIKSCEGNVESALHNSSGRAGVAQPCTTSAMDLSSSRPAENGTSQFLLQLGEEPPAHFTVFHAAVLHGMSHIWLLTFGSFEVVVVSWCSWFFCVLQRGARRAPAGVGGAPRTLAPALRQRGSLAG